MKKGKITKTTAIIIGVLIAIPLVIFGFLMLQGAFTRASTDAPQNISLAKRSSNAITITWTTDSDTTGIVEYGTSADDLRFTQPSLNPSTTHRVALTLLKPDTTYYYRIKVGENVYDNGGVPYTFTTRAAGEGDTNPSGTVSTTPQPSTASASITEIPASVLSTTPADSLSPTLTPEGAQPTLKASTPTQKAAATSTPVQSCPSTNNCTLIQSKLGKGCSSSQYIQCLKSNSTVTSTPTTGTKTPTLTPTSTSAPTPYVAGPDNLYIIAKTDTSLTLQWRDKSDNEDGFVIERLEVLPDASFSVVATKSANITTHQDTGLTSGKSYRYRIRGFKVGNVYSGYSNDVQDSTN